MKNRLLIFASAITLALSTFHGNAASLPDRIIEAIDIVAEKQGSAYPIPQALLDHARGVAIVKVTKAGLVIGGSGGQGVLLAKNGKTWSAPAAFNISGGSFGAQIGFETKRLIIVINSDDSLHLFASEGATKWDATAAGTAGTDSAHATESEWAEMPIVIFENNNGVFGGATFGGTSVNVDEQANRQSYGYGVYIRDILNGKVAPTELGHRLQKILSGHR